MTNPESETANKAEYLKAQAIALIGLIFFLLWM
jgi:hypothetical protein